MIKKIKFWIFHFLKKTQKYTGTDNVYLAKGGSWLILSQVGGTIIFMGLAMAWANLVPKEIYGQYKFILSIAGLLAIFSLPGMETAVTQATARGFDGTIKPVVKTKFKWSILALLAGFFLALYYWLQGNQVLSLSFLIAGALSPIFNNLNVYIGYLTGKKRFDLRVKFSLARTFFAALAIVTAIFLTKNVIYLILVYFVFNTALRAFFYFLTFKKLPPSQNIDPKAVNYGKHLSLISVMTQILAQIDKILVFNFLGAAELAIYSFATLLPERVDGFTKILQKLALPKFSVRDEGEIKKVMWPRVIRLGLLLVIVIILYILAAGLIFKLFFPAYMDSVFYSRIYAISLLAGIAILPSTAFAAKRKIKIIYQYNIISSLIGILIIFISLYFFGLLGLVVGITIHRLITTALVFSLFRHL